MSPNNSDRARTKTIKVVCDRCKDVVEAIRGEDFISGVFDMRTWVEYRRGNERYVCASCMYADSNYVARYGSCF
jgi:hypothetical protein